MTRVKRGTISNKTRRNVLSKVKGYRFGRSTKKRQAREAIFHAGKYAFAHRRDKKNDFRRLFNVRINAGLRLIDEKLSYSKFIGVANKKGVELNSKMLATLAEKQPGILKQVLETVSRPEAQG